MSRTIYLCCAWIFTVSIHVVVVVGYLWIYVDSGSLVFICRGFLLLVEVFVFWRFKGTIVVIVVDCCCCCLIRYRHEMPGWSR